MTDQVEFQIGDADGVVGLRPLPAEQGAQPGEQFGHRKRFGEIIIAARIQPTHPVFDFGSRGQEQNWGRDVLTTELAHDGKTILWRASSHPAPARQGMDFREPEGLIAIRRDIHRVALRHQSGGCSATLLTSSATRMRIPVIFIGPAPEIKRLFGFAGSGGPGLPGRLRQLKCQNSPPEVRSSPGWQAGMGDEISLCYAASRVSRPVRIVTLWMSVGGWLQWKSGAGNLPILSF